MFAKCFCARDRVPQARNSTVGNQLMPQRTGTLTAAGGAGDYRVEGEKSPLLQRDTLITIDYVSNFSNCLCSVSLFGLMTSTVLKPPTNAHPRL